MSRRRQARLPSAPVTARIEALSHEGRGIARIEGKATFVAGALPGEEVSFRYTGRRGRHDEAVTESVHTPSPDRVEPPCRFAGICGGCSLQHLSPEAQRAHKQAGLLERLLHAGAGAPEQILPPLTGPTEGYRHKARLMLRWVDAKGGLLIGFSERGGRKVTEITACRVLAEPLGSRIAWLRERLGALDVARQLAQMEVAIGDDGNVALVLRNLAPVGEEDLTRLSALAAELGWTIHLQPGGPDTVHCISHATPPPLGYRLLDGRLSLGFEPLDFTQINPHINRMMVERVLELLAPGPDSRVLDLFCGIGNFSLPLATRAAHVHGVEGAATLVARAARNAERNRLGNVDFSVADLAAPAIVAPWLAGGFDRILIDPPRTGAAELLGQIRLGDCRRLVYVSCDPATLARDAGILRRQHGWRLAAAGIMDMFPHTTHVESVALFLPPGRSREPG
jgi:23S rRNA (uracil1939-C5)-methyltransferase